MSDAPEEGKKSVFRFLGQLFKDAIGVEFLTDAGRMNFFGMLFSLMLIIVLTTGGFVKWLAESAMQAWGNGPGPSEDANNFETFAIYLAANLICVLMVGLLVIFARRHDPPTSDKGA